MQQNHEDNYPENQSPSHQNQEKNEQTSDQPTQDDIEERQRQQSEQDKMNISPSERKQEHQINHDTNIEDQQSSLNQIPDFEDTQQNNSQNLVDSEQQKSHINQHHQENEQQTHNNNNSQQQEETDHSNENLNQQENLTEQNNVPQSDNPNKLDSNNEQEINKKENQILEQNERNSSLSHLEQENKQHQDNSSHQLESKSKESSVQKIDFQNENSDKSPINKQNIISPKFQQLKSQKSQEESVLTTNFTTIRQASFNDFNDDDKKVLDELQLENGQLTRRYSELNANEFSQKLKVLFKNCFYSNELDSLDQWFKELQRLIVEIQVCEPSVLDQAFFKKVILLAQLENPKKSLKVVSLFHQLFNERLPDYARIVVDIINSYYILLENFKNTKIEIDLKIGFNSFQTLLDSEGHYEEFKVLIEQQTTLKSLNFSELSSDQKEIFEMIKHYSKFKEIHQKQESIKYIILLLGKCDTVIQQYKIMVYHLSPVFLELSNVNFENNESKIEYFNQVLDIIDRYIFPIEFLINFETSRIQGTKTYHLRNLKQIVQYFNKLYTLVGGFINSILLMPQEIQLNLRALFIIRRMYYFFYDDLSMRQLMEGPIVVILSNLAMFTKDIVQKKEPTLFLHKLVEDKDTLISLKEKLESNQYIATLKENKYFGVMAKSYPFDIDVQYNFKSLNFQVNYPVYKKIDAGSFFHYNILVTKQDTIIYWSFKTLNYDIRFGLFKMDTLSSELQIDSYEEEKQVKAIVKLQKADSHKEPVMAYSLVSLPGFYRIVFDNTYSYWREKELLYTIQVLEL